MNRVTSWPALAGLLVMAVVLSLSARAQQGGVVTLESTITGSQEQPKVITIVPWQDPPRVGDMFEEVRSLIDDEIMQPIDREVLSRQVNYYGRLQREAWLKNNKPVEPQPAEVSP